MISFKLVTNLKEFDQMMAELSSAKFLEVDLETTSLHPRKGEIRLIQLNDQKNIYVVDVWKFDNIKQLLPLKDILESQDIKKIIQNAAFEYKWFLAKLGIRVYPIFDTFIASKLLDFSARHRLSDIASRYLNVDISKAEQKSDWAANELTQEQYEYAATDVLYLARLREELLKGIYNTGQLDALKLELDCTPAISEMELWGMPINYSKYASLVEANEKTKAEKAKILIEFLQTRGGRKDKPKQVIQESIFGEEVVLRTSASINIDSWQQVLPIFREMGIPIDSTDQKVLAPMLNSYPELGTLIDYREYSKLCSTYGHDLLAKIEENRIYPSFNQIGTVTLRMSSSGPNLQNQPSTFAFRDCYQVKSDRKLVLSDYAGYELRILAELSNDKVMLDAFNNNKDLHSVTAASVFGIPYEKAKTEHKAERQVSKICFSGDTEILTEKGGWIRFDAYDGQDKVAQYILPAPYQYNPPLPKSNRWGHPTGKLPKWDGSGYLEFVHPLRFTTFDNQQLFHQVDRNTDILITKDHEIVFGDANARPRKLPASDVTEGNMWFIPCGGELINMSKDYELSPLETQFLAMLVSDGSFTEDNSIRLGFSKERKIERCRDILNRLGVSYSENTIGIKYRYRNFRLKISDTYTKSIVNKMLLFTTPKKDLYWDCLFRLDAKTYLDEAAFWDGHRVNVKGTTTRNRITFSSISRATIDVMQAMCCLAGYQSRMVVASSNTCERYYCLSFRPIAPARHAVSWDLKETSRLEKVYCVKVPSGAVLIRRNGKVAVCGNCNFSVVYGISASALANRLKAEGINADESFAQKLIDGFYESYSGAANWLANQEKKAFRQSEIRTVGGHLIKINFDRNDKKQLGSAKRNFRNYPIQSLNACSIKLALKSIHDELVKNYPTAHIVNAVHDEIIIESDEKDAPQIRGLLESKMVEAGQKYLQNVKIVADAAVCDSWGEKG